MMKAVSDFLTSKRVPPTSTWLESFSQTAKLDVPQNALQQTAYFQILTSDITTSVQPTYIFPTSIVALGVAEQRIPGPILVQVSDIEDISSSLWSQIEAIESQERGETTRGREVIRVLPEVQTTDSPTSLRSSAMHKLCLQDVRNTKVYALETTSIPKIDLSLPIGTKLILRDITVARGVIMLQPRNVEILGGRVEAWDHEWRTSRKARLLEKVEPH